MREIVLDTETTGISPVAGHRIVEIGAVELQNGRLTGITFQQYVNPEQDVPQEAFRVHGLSRQFLSSFPCFAAICANLLNFLQDSPLVIHNARFDLGFLNAELVKAQRSKLTNKAIDTVLLAKQKYPGSPVNLDALCRRLHLDLSHRQHHGALLDAQLLAKVYLHLRTHTILELTTSSTAPVPLKRTPRSPRPFPLSSKELAAYADMQLLLLS